MRKGVLLIILLHGTLSVSIVGCKKDKGPVAAFRIVRDCNGSDSCRVSFINESEGARSYIWHFGDYYNSISVDTNPAFTYGAGTWCLVTLEAIGEHSQDKHTDTVFLGQRPDCETKGAFPCAKRLTPGKGVADLITDYTQPKYYYFNKQTAGKAFFRMPYSVDAVVDLLATAQPNSLVLASDTTKAGGEISLWSPTLPPGEYYLRVKQSTHSGYPFSYVLTYLDIDANLGEPNNTFKLATPLVPNLAMQGTMQPDGDKDYFKFSLSRPAVVDLTISNVPHFTNNGGFWMWVYSSNVGSSYVTQGAWSSGTTIGNLSTGPFEPGERYIELFAGTGAESQEVYELSMKLDTSDKYETNQTFNTATPITYGQTLKATIKAADDVDYYAVPYRAGGYITIRIPVVPSGLKNMFVELYEGPFESKKIATAVGDENRPIVLTYSGYPSYPFYIKVFGYPKSYSNDLYEITVQ